VTVATRPAKFYTIEQLGPAMYRTPENYLVIYDTPIARTGIQLYHYSEIINEHGDMPFEGDARGVVKIHRDEDEVFRPETIASFNGAPLVNDHPDVDVDASNWNELAVGVVMNPLRGIGAEDQYLVADIKITNQQAIEDVLAGKRELSSSYHAEYEKLGPAEGRQINIIGNHVAIVAKGRCGSTCRIEDSGYRTSDSISRGGSAMNKLSQWIDSLKQALSSKDEKKALALLDAAPTITQDGDQGIHVHMHEGSGAAANNDRKWSDEKLEEKFGEHEKAIADCRSTMDGHHKAVMDSLEELKKGMGSKDAEAKEEKEIEGELKEEAPAGTGDAAMKATDSKYLADSYQQTISMAEIIAPGLHYAVFDQAMKPTKTFAYICGMRRKALLVGSNDSETHGIIESIQGGKALTQDSLNAMPCKDVRTLFHTVATIKRERNNRRPVPALVAATNDGKKSAGPQSVREWNELNRKHYEGK
jgi:uncharacterized protein